MPKPRSPPSWNLTGTACTTFTELSTPPLSTGGRTALKVQTSSKLISEERADEVVDDLGLLVAPGRAALPRERGGGARYTADTGRPPPQLSRDATVGSSRTLTLRGRRCRRGTHSS